MHAVHMCGRQRATWRSWFCSFTTRIRRPNSLSLLPNELSYQLSTFLWDSFSLNPELTILFQLDWLAIKPPEFTCLCPPPTSAGITDAHCYTDAGDSNSGPQDCTTNILKTELSPRSPCNYILMCTLWNLAWKCERPIEIKPEPGLGELASGW